MVIGEVEGNDDIYDSYTLYYVIFFSYYLSVNLHVYIILCSEFSISQTWFLIFFS